MDRMFILTISINYDVFSLQIWQWRAWSLEKSTAMELINGIYIVIGNITLVT